jgi:hypothetical protein
MPGEMSYRTNCRRVGTAPKSVVWVPAIEAIVDAVPEFSGDVLLTEELEPPPQQARNTMRPATLTVR